MKLKDVTSQNWDFYFNHREVLDQGVYTWYTQCPFPFRAYHDNNLIPNFHLTVLERLGTVKKYLFNLVHLSKLVFPRVFNIKKYQPFLWQMYSLFDWNLQEYMIKDSEFSVPVWEVGKAVNRFLGKIGLNIVLAAKLARVVMMILEFDNAYRWRLQDILGLATLNGLLNNTKAEIKRLMGIYLDREVLRKEYNDYGARGKILRIVGLINVLLYVPRFKKAFKFAIEGMDLEKVKFDKNDRFHLSWWYGYNFEGKTFEERFGEYADIYKDIPFRKKESPELTANFMTGN